MNKAALITEAHDMALQLMPELRELPLYVMAADDLRGLPCGPDSCGTLGWAANDLFFNREFADRLGGRYCGPGNLFVVDLDAIEAAALPGHFERCVRSVALHETAHLSLRCPIEPPPDTPRLRKLQLERMEKIYTLPERDPGDVDDPHDWRFIRRVCHLFYRACAAGFDIPPARLLPQWQSRAELYLAMLLPECIRMKDATFAEMELQPAPAGFMELWLEDLDYYRKTHARTK